MELSDIKKTLDTAGYPVAYYSFPEGKAPPLPFICYTEADSNNFYADGIVYSAISRINVELYTKTKNVQAEKKVEKALEGFAWRKSGGYIDSEKCHMVLYEMEV
jgi:hypothetical protein